MEQFRTKLTELMSPIRSYGLYILVLILLACIPFNIAYHFNSEFAYIDGFFVNYLDFVVHVVDVAVVLVLGWLLLVEGIWKWRTFWLGGAILIGFFLFHNLFFRNDVVMYTSVRVLIYAVCGIGLYVFIKLSQVNEKRRCGTKKHSMSFFDIEIFGVTFGNWIVIIFVTSALLQVAIAFHQFVSGEMLGLSFLGESAVAVGGYDASSISLPGGIFLRGYGTFPHPNVLGGYLVAVLLVTLSLTVHLREFNRALLIVSNVLICVGIFITWSRIAWILAVLLIIIWIGKIVWDKGRIAFGVYLTGLVILLVACGVWLWLGNDTVSENIRDRLIDQSSLVDISIIERRELVERAIVTIKDNPALGVGAGMFIPSLSEDPVVSSSGIRVMQPVHNVGMLVLAEIGVIGVMFLVGVVIFVFRRSKFTLAAISTLIIVAAIGMVDHYFWTLPQGMMILLILLLGCMLWNSYPQKV